jgi:hypothetical protein
MDVQVTTHFATIFPIRDCSDMHQLQRQSSLERDFFATISASSDKGVKSMAQRMNAARFFTVPLVCSALKGDGCLRLVFLKPISALADVNEAYAHHRDRDRQILSKRFRFLRHGKRAAGR